MKLSRTAMLCLLPLTIALSACGNSSSEEAQAKLDASSAVGDDIQSQNISMAALKVATGFAVGNPAAKRDVYVMFDPQCSHCAKVWSDTKSLWPKARFIWVPVGFLSKTSALQGAGILKSPIPSQAMDEHEASLAEHKGGLEVNAGDVPRPLKDAVERNTQLLHSFGPDSVPLIIGTNATTKKVVVIRGEVKPDALAAQMGWADVAQGDKPATSAAK